MPYVGKTPRTIVYWTHLSDLPPDLVKDLKAGEPPWDKNRVSEQFNADIESFVERMKDGKPPTDSTVSTEDGSSD